MINIQNAEFLRSAAFLRDFPPSGVRQVVFSGRSNVGKSSIINCILGRKNLARTGQKPGKTININLYKLDDRHFFSDLPGYGFAKVSHAERERWGELMTLYFDKCSRDICLGILVFDARRQPTDEDLEMVSLFENMSIPYVVCANKCDKLTKTEFAALGDSLTESFGIRRENLFLCSASTGLGKKELSSKIFEAFGE